MKPLPPESLLIEKARGEDAATILDVRRRAVLQQCRRHYPQALLERWIAGEASPAFIEVVASRFYVARLGGQLVASGMLDPEQGRIDAIFVEPLLMGRSIGRRMMLHLEALARAREIPELTLDSTLNAAAFYRHLGYCGEQISQYHSPRGFSLDCIPMRKFLSR